MPESKKLILEDIEDIIDFLIDNSQEKPDIQYIHLSDNIVTLIRKRQKEIKIYLSNNKIPIDVLKYIYSILDGNVAYGDDDVIVDDINPDLDESEPIVDTTNPSGLDKGYIKYLIAFSKMPFDTLLETRPFISLSIKKVDTLNLTLSKNRMVVKPEMNNPYSSLAAMSKEIINLAVEQ